MSLPHFYLDEQVLSGEAQAVFPLRLAADDARHARVLRLASGEHVAVVDAARDYFECEVVSFEGALPQVRIAQRLERGACRPSVVLVQGLAKGDKMETVIRHATELGVAEFLPLACERSVMRLDAKKGAAKAQRWRAVAKSAAMQSGQPEIPDVREPMGLAQACVLVADADAVLVCWEEAPGTALVEDALEGVDPEGARVAVVVGPEGGLARREVDALLACGPRASLVTLGPSILRTETAGIVAPALVIHELARAARARRARA